MCTNLAPVGLRSSVLALAWLAVAGPAFAASPYDGSWSVVISTRGGACQPTVRYGVQIENGRVSAGGGGGEGMVAGRVTSGGAVRVSVQSGGSSANGSGHLSRASGSGVWRGQGQAGACEGTWVAQRAGYQQQAQGSQGSNGPLYNYAPGPIAPESQSSGGTCAMRFHSYNPATGTYLGFDGIRHPCR